MHFLIIENDPLWQFQIQIMLEELPNTTTETVETYTAASAAITKINPDIILAAVVLPDGISFNLFTNTAPPCPIIFFTNFPENAYLQRALSFPAATFLVKPFHHFTLQSAIHCVTSKFSFFPNSEAKPILEGGIWVNDKYRQKIRVPLNEILYIDGEGNYVTIHTATERQYVLKTSLRKVSTLLNSQFIQIQRGVVINKTFIQRIDISKGKVNVKGVILPIGRTFQKHLLAVASQS